MFKKETSEKYPISTRFLVNAILKDRLANSYIFIGKDKADIFSAAIQIAKILNCQGNKERLSEPCEKCINCKWLDKNEHPQAFMSITPDPKSKKDQIKVETIRELTNDLQKSSGYFRVIFFESSDLGSLTADCCNLLLKIVEEPPEKTIFIFGNITKNNILPTILSRSQTVYFNKQEKSLFKDSPEDNVFVDCFPQNTKSALEKAKEAEQYLSKSETEPLDFLYQMAVANYDKNKHSNKKDFCKLHENLIKTQKKLKSFIQPKFAIEDLFLSLTTSLRAE